MVATVETLTLLGERTEVLAAARGPLACARRAALTLEPEDAVWVSRPAGSLTGRVGDFTLGLTKPVLAGEG